MTGSPPWKPEESDETDVSTTSRGKSTGKETGSTKSSGGRTGRTSVSTGSKGQARRDRVEQVRRRFPMGYVLAGLGFVCAVAIVGSQVLLARSSAQSADQQLARIEVAYARLRNQLAAAHLAPVEPSLPVLLGPSGVAGNGPQGAPPVLMFKISSPSELATPGVVLRCTDDTGSGNYLCTPTKG